MLRFGTERAARKLSGKRFGAGHTDSFRMNGGERFRAVSFTRQGADGTAFRGEPQKAGNGALFSFRMCNSKRNLALLLRQLGIEPIKSTKTRSLYADSGYRKSDTLGTRGNALYRYGAQPAAPAAAFFIATRTGKRLWCIFNYTTQQRLCQPVISI